MTPINRILKDKLRYWLNKRKVLVLTGARQVGKTTLLHDLFDGQEILWLNGDDPSLRSRLVAITIAGINDLIGGCTICSNWFVGIRNFGQGV